MEIEEEKVATQSHLLSDEIIWRIIIHKEGDLSNKRTASLLTEQCGSPISHQTVKESGILSKKLPLLVLVGPHKEDQRL